MKMFAKNFRRFALTFMLCAVASFAAIPAAFAAKPGVPVFVSLEPLHAGGAWAGFKAPADNGGVDIINYHFAGQIVDCDDNPEWNEAGRYATGSDGEVVSYTGVFIKERRVSKIRFGGSDCHFTIGGNDNYFVVAPGGIGRAGYAVTRQLGSPWTGFATGVRMRANNGELGDWSPYEYAVFGTPLPLCANFFGLQISPRNNGFSLAWRYCNLSEINPAPDGFDIRWRRINSDGSVGAWTLYPSESQKQTSATTLAFDVEANKAAAPAVARASFADACGQDYATLFRGAAILCNFAVTESLFIDDNDFSPHRGRYEVQVAAYNEHGRSAWTGGLGAGVTPLSTDKVVTAGADDTRLSTLELRAPDGTFYPLLDGLSMDAATRLFAIDTGTYFAKIPKAPATVEIRIVTEERGATITHDGMRVPEVFGTPGIFTIAADAADGVTTYNFTVTSADTTATRNYSLEVDRIEIAPIVCTDADIPSPPTGLTAFNYVPGDGTMQAYWTKSPDKDNGGANVSILHGWSFNPGFGKYVGRSTDDDVYPNAGYSFNNFGACSPSAAPLVLGANDDCTAIHLINYEENFRDFEQSFFAVAMQNECGASDFVIKEFNFGAPYAQTITSATAGENNTVRLDWENEGNIDLNLFTIDNTREGMTIRWRNTSAGEKFLAPGESPTAADNRALDVVVPGATTFYEIPSGTLTDAGVYEFQVAPYNLNDDNSKRRNAWSDAHGVLVGANEASILALEVRETGGKVFPLLDGLSLTAAAVEFASGTRAYSVKIPATVSDIVFQLSIPVTSRVTSGGNPLTNVSPGIHTFAATPALGMTDYTFTVTSADGNSSTDYIVTVNSVAIGLTALQAEVTAVDSEAVAQRGYETAVGDMFNVMPAFQSAHLTYTLTLPYPVTTFRFIAPVNDADLFDAAGISVLNENDTELYSYPVYESSVNIPAGIFTDDVTPGEHTRIFSLSDAIGDTTRYEITITSEELELPPAKPTMLAATRDAMQLDLTWMAPASAQPVTTYFVRWADTSTATATTTYMYINDGGENGVDTGATDATYTIDPIEIATTYAIQVRAASLRGIGEWSDELIREGEFAPGAPTMLDGNYVGAQITLTWSVPPVHPPVTSHLVRWADANVPDEWLNTNTAAGVDTGGTDETYVIRNLDQNLAYAVQVAAVNALATGAWSDVVNLAESGRPSAPTMLGAIREDAKITLTWAAPPPPVAPVETYFVRVALEPDLDTWLAGAGGTDGVDTGNTETSISFTFNAEFKKNIAYAMQVAAANINGTGLWSKTLFSGVGDLRFVNEDETPDLFFHTKPLGRVITLREATDGIPPYQYALDGDLPPGMSFVAETREFSGAPSSEDETVTLTYRVTDHAENRITDEFDVTAVTVTLDADGDDKATAADGILIARYLLGVTGEALTFAQTATDAADIKTTLETAVKTTALNVNADTVTDADDGILIARYILGMRNAALELVANTAADIAAKVEALLPAQ